MNRNLILILSLLCCINIHASDYSYSVTGEDVNGKQYEGTIESNKGERDVSGTLTDEEGKTIDFDGQWDGKGQITGETENGLSVDLTTD